MDIILWFFLALFVFFFTVGIPSAITYLLYKFLNKKYPNKSYKYFSLIPISLYFLFLTHSVWILIFPTDDFYKEDYKEVTKIDFPKDGKIIYKTATLPDHFGDYTSLFVLQTNREEYFKINNQIKNIGFTEIQRDNWHAHESPVEVMEKFNLKTSKQFSYTIEGGKHYYIAFLNDEKTILIRRISW